MNIDIENKIALATGANRGIGKTILESFLDKGAKKVYAGVRTISTADPLIEKYGDRVEAIQIDLAKTGNDQCSGRKCNRCRNCCQQCGRFKKRNAA